MGDHTTRERVRLPADRALLPSLCHCRSQRAGGCEYLPCHAPLAPGMGSQEPRERRKGRPVLSPVLTSAGRNGRRQGLRRMAGAPFPLCFHAVDFPLTLEESGNFQGRDDEKLGRWVCNGHCLGDVLEPGDQVPSWLGLSVPPSVRRPALSAGLRPRTTRSGQEPHGPGAPWDSKEARAAEGVPLSRARVTQGRASQTGVRGLRGGHSVQRVPRTRGNTGPLPEAAAALGYQRRGLSSAGSDGTGAKSQYFPRHINFT